MRDVEEVRMDGELKVSLKLRKTQGAPVQRQTPNNETSGKCACNNGNTLSETSKA